MLRRAVAIPTDEKRLVLEAFVRLAWARLQLAVGRPNLEVQSPVETVAYARHCPQKICLAIGRAAKLLPGTACLPKALAMTHMLRAHGHCGVLRLGLKNEGDQLAAHAWVEVDSGPVSEDSFRVSDFTTLPSFSRERDHSHAG